MARPVRERPRALQGLRDQPAEPSRLEAFEPLAGLRLAELRTVRVASRDCGKVESFRGWRLIQRRRVGDVLRRALEAR